MGLLVGLLLPLGRSRVGAGILGLIGSVPYFVLLRLSMTGEGSWSRVDTATIAVLAVFFGIPAGLIAREIFYEPDENGKHRDSDSSHV